MPSNLFPHAYKIQKNDREANSADEPPKKLPNGVVLGEDGKPCRTCTSSAAWMAMMKSASPNTSKATTSSSNLSPIRSMEQESTASFDQPDDCPPDVDVLGRSTWTLLHSLTATYPPAPTPAQQEKTRSFLRLFADLYPCWVCAEDFRDWMAQPSNAPRLNNQEEFGRWMCRAHNAVNEKLGKATFDCDRWRERWKDGWKDGRCG